MLGLLWVFMASVKVENCEAVPVYTYSVTQTYMHSSDDYT